MCKTIIKPGVRPARIEYKEVTGGLAVRRTSDLSGAINERVILGLTEAQLKDWCNNNKLIQNVMPDLGNEDREFLISGITPSEWDAMDEED